MCSARGYLRVVFEMSARVDHIGIATKNLETYTPFWTAIGFTQDVDEVNEEQGVNIRFFSSPDNSSLPRIELLEPRGTNSPIGRFIKQRGEGIQQLAVEVDDIDSMISLLKQMGCRMINEEAVSGASGSRIAFVHPSSTGGVLVELVQH